MEEEERPKAMGRRLVALLLEPKIFVFVMACVIVGMCTGLLWNFLFWYWMVFKSIHSLFSFIVKFKDEFFII